MICSECDYSRICPDAYKPISRFCSGMGIDFDVDEEEEDSEDVNDVYY